jgi:hypothetical protein
MNHATPPSHEWTLHGSLIALGNHSDERDLDSKCVTGRSCDATGLLTLNLAGPSFQRTRSEMMLGRIDQLKRETPVA